MGTPQGPPGPPYRGGGPGPQGPPYRGPGPGPGPGPGQGPRPPQGRPPYPPQGYPPQGPPAGRPPYPPQGPPPRQPGYPAQPGQQGRPYPPQGPYQGGPGPRPPQDTLRPVQRPTAQQPIPRRAAPEPVEVYDEPDDYDEPPEAPEQPDPPAKRGISKKLQIIIAVVVALAIAVAVGLYFFGNSASTAQKGDCLKGDLGQGAVQKEFSKVDCGPGANYKVIGRFEDKTESEARAKGKELCQALPTAEAFYWQRHSGDKGAVLCLETFKN